MVKRREVVKFLKENGFEEKGGTNHEKFYKGDKRTVVSKAPRDFRQALRGHQETGGVEIAPPTAPYDRRRKMIFLCEFEVFKDEDGFYLALPFGLEGGTQGLDYREACEMAVDWLECEAEGRLLAGEPIPELPIGNEPQNGGKVILIGIDAKLENLNTVSASKAAEMLGVSRGRVSQMLANQQLLGYREGRDTFITLDSINARLEESPKAGRPRKEPAAA